MTHLAKQQLEQVHLRHLKYLLGINRRATNAAAWGETGSYPLLIEALKLSIKYFKRIMGLPSTQLVKAAMTEQVNLSLSWYSGIEDIIKCFNDINPRTYARNSSPLLNATLFADASSPDQLAENLQKLFTDSWRSKVYESRKLSFYKEVKTVFAWEPYLNHASTFDDRRSTAQIRCSSHKLRIETGRYDNTPIESRTCTFCDSNGSLRLIEDESHLLTFCPQGKNIRDKFTRASRNICNSNGNGQTNIITTLSRTQDQYEDLNDQEMNLIRLSCSAIRKIYTLNLNFKDSLNVKDGK